MRRLICMLFLLLIVPAAHAASQELAPIKDPKVNEEFNHTNIFYGNDGETLYKVNCEVCHMAKGEGASGVAVYPALANNPNVLSPEYVAGVIINGLRGMPYFKNWDNDLTDEQIAAVVNYVGTNFGNQSTSTITAKDVHALYAK